MKMSKCTGLKDEKEETITFNNVSKYSRKSQSFSNTGNVIMFIFVNIFRNIFVIVLERVWLNGSFKREIHFLCENVCLGQTKIKLLSFIFIITFFYIFLFQNTSPEFARTATDKELGWENPYVCVTFFCRICKVELLFNEEDWKTHFHSHITQTDNPYVVRLFVLNIYYSILNSSLQ